MSTGICVEAVRPNRLNAADRGAWSRYFQRIGQPWRTEPEIDDRRKAELESSRGQVADNVELRYPFGGETLDRADVEYLLATHDKGQAGHGPLTLKDLDFYPPKGIDLRGARIVGEKQEDGSYGPADLHSLPLTRLRAGLTWYEREGIEALPVTEQRKEELREAAAIRLEGADLHETHLESACLYRAHLEGACLRGAYFDSFTDLREVYLEGGRYGPAQVIDVRWGGVNLSILDWNHFDELGEARQAEAWNSSSTVKGQMGKDDLPRGTELYRRAVRANRQLAAALLSQGLSEESAVFAYLAQRLQKQVFRLEARQATWPGGSKRLSFLFSGIIDTLVGYGYKPVRAFFWYTALISSFAIAYYVLGRIWQPQLSIPGSFVFSLTSFHGRGFFPGSTSGGAISLDNELVRLAAIEAAIGLFFEITFIATFTRRYLGG